MTFSTNIRTETEADEVKSAFKSDRRIWSFDLEKSTADRLLHIAADVGPAEVQAKIHSLGFEASLVHEGE